MKLEIKLDVVKEARHRARLVNGRVPGKRVIPDKRQKPAKHKIRYESTIDEN